VALRIIGCGNIDRGDDAAGLLVARRLHARGVEIPAVEIPAVEIIEHSGQSLSLMDCWTTFEQVILVDATAPGGKPGQVQVWNALVDELPEDFFPSSTHAFGVREAVELARTMNRLPQTLLIYGIEGKQFSFAAPLSAEVEHAVASVVERLVRHVSDLLIHNSQRSQGDNLS